MTGARLISRPSGAEVQLFSVSARGHHYVFLTTADEEGFARVIRQALRWRSDPELDFTRDDLFSLAVSVARQAGSLRD